MGDENTTGSEREIVPGKKAQTKTRLICIVAIVAGVGLLVAGGWLYYNATQTIRDQKVVINDLRKKLKKLGVEVPVDPGEPVEEATASCNGGSDYAADIGNFSLTLSNPNVIIRNLDANFEGGPITELAIGQCIEGETNVVDAYPTHKVTILGHPASNAAALRASFEAEWGSPLTAAGTATVDGVTAQVYTGAGLFNTKLLYFDHNSIGYQIELPDTSATTDAILTDVLSDWSFTP